MGITKRDDTKCYRKSGGGDAHEDDTFEPCDGIVDSGACCGKGHTCLPTLGGEAHLCYSPNNNTDFISYYIAGCTDSSYKDGSCTNHCVAENYGAVKWQPNTNNWACCGQNPTGHVDCTQSVKDTFKGPSQQTLDDYRNDSANVTHAAKLAVGVIVGIVIACVVAVIGCCVLTWCCCFSGKARERRSRGKFMPLGKTRGTEDVWDANMHNNNELHQGPPGSYGYGGQGAPYNPPQQGPQYTVANFR